VLQIETIALWGGFISALAAMLAFDLLVIHRKAHVIGVREALSWTAFWIVAALLFAAGVYVVGGGQKGTEFLTGYIIEKSLSVDNVFIFLVIFQYFAVPPVLQPKVLHWGIVGALIMRLVFILVGAALLHAFDWMIFVFGGILLLSAGRLAFQSEHEIHPERNPVIKLIQRVVPLSNQYSDANFFARRAGVFMATPLFAVLIMVETTDLIFAMDSIPAIFTITRDPFIIFTSNAFAILGLRALYFAIAGVMKYFTYLRQGLVIILAFVGVKMIISEWYHLPVLVSLAVVAIVLAVSVALSLLFPKPPEELAPRTEEEAFGHRAAHEPLISSERERE
jgi:tellurite resistance protein TerC